MELSLVAWLALGVIAGLLASRMIDKTGSGVVVDAIVGVFGFLVGGFVFNAIGHPAPGELRIIGTFFAFAGAVAALLAYHPPSGGRAS